MPTGQFGLWHSLATKDGQSSYSRILAVNLWISFLSGTRGNLSI